MKRNIVALACIGFLVGVSSLAFSADPYRLKSGAEGTNCVECHKDFAKNLDYPYLHPLMRKRTCTGCHEPHTCSYPNLLLRSPSKLCLECHQAKILPREARSVHPFVNDGDCAKCHNSHGSNNKSLLKSNKGQLCQECHGEIRDKASKARFKHSSMTSGDGCLNCHLSHASKDQDLLLKKDVPGLCKGCHNTDSQAFRKQHMDYQVSNADCVLCHDAHGSDKKGMVYDTTHDPFVRQACGKCHSPATGGSKAVSLKTPGAQGCAECHQETINESLSKNNIHWPLVDDQSCSNCHSPHASKRKGLLKGPTSTVCGTCHSDTIALQERTRKNPKNTGLCKPVKEGECSECHSPHSSDNVLLLRDKDTNEQVCGRCHEWQKHSSHPIGEKIIDQRDPNLTLGCLSCHKGCGTDDHPQMLLYGTTYELCVQCHTDRKR